MSTPLHELVEQFGTIRLDADGLAIVLRITNNGTLIATRPSRSKPIAIVNRDGRVSATSPAVERAIVHALADPTGAALEAARATGRCACCGRRLVDPASVARGLGADCAAKLQPSAEAA